MSSTDRINFFVIGAAKGGTTTVFERLNKRDDVYLSPLKEPNYYSSDIDITKFSNEFKANTRLDLETYFTQQPLAVRQIGFVRDPKKYEKLFTPAPFHARLIGECSTSYLWSENAAEEIFHAHPSSKILIMLRHPIKRLYSHYMMARKYGFTSLPLQSAVEKDLAHETPGWGASELFVELGMYTDQISRYKFIFPEGQIKIMLTPDLRNPAKWDELLTWLDLPPIDVPQTTEKNSSDANTAGLPRFERLNRWLTSQGLKKKLGNLIPSKLKAPLVAWYYKAENLPKISEAERKYLEGIYSEELLRLKAEHGISL